MPSGLPRSGYGAIVVYEDDRDDMWQIKADDIGADDWIRGYD